MQPPHTAAWAFIDERAEYANYPGAFTPDTEEHWTEPGLPWLTAGMELPVGRHGLTLVRYTVYVCRNIMAPRFPIGCQVNVAPVSTPQDLVVGRVYLHVFTDGKTGEQESQLGRLQHIGSHHLEVTFDNAAITATWPLRDDEKQALWDVFEVTHYVAHPRL